MFNYFVLGLKKYAEFRGRSRRSEYWYFYLLCTLINILFTVVVYFATVMHYSTNELAFLSNLFTLFVFLPNIAVTVRRLHDVGKSSTYILLIFVIIIGWIWLLLLLVEDSQPGENRWGENPKGIGNKETDENLISQIGQ